ncbi:MAG: YtxH domain-containing protein [Ferruginibacter sp.]
MSTLKKFLTGVAVGAALGILYAPAKGSKTRRRLAKRGRDIKESWREMKDAVCNKIDDIREAVNEEAEDISAEPMA